MTVISTDKLHPTGFLSIQAIHDAMDAYAKLRGFEYEVQCDIELIFRCKGCFKKAAECRSITDFSGVQMLNQCHFVQVKYEVQKKWYVAFATRKNDAHCCGIQSDAQRQLQAQVQQAAAPARALGRAHARPQLQSQLRPLQLAPQPAIAPSKCEKCLNAILKKILSGTCEEQAIYASWTIERIRNDYRCHCPFVTATADFPVSSDAAKPHEYTTKDALVDTLGAFATSHGFTYRVTGAAATAAFGGSGVERVECNECIKQIEQLASDYKLRVATERRTKRIAASNAPCVPPWVPPPPHSVTFTQAGANAVYVSHMQPAHICRNQEGVKSTSGYYQGSSGYQFALAFANTLAGAIPVALGKRKRIDAADVERLVAIGELVSQLEQ